jgi:YD repeat-containing protein
MKYLSLILLVASLGCASKPQILPMGHGEYMISKKGSSGFSRMSSIKSDAYEEMNNYARSKGLEAEIISTNEIPPKLGDYPVVEVKFRLVQRSSRISRDTKVNSSQTTQTYDSLGRPTSSTTNTRASEDSTRYQKLREIGSLYANGVLTEEEYKREKARILRD